MITIPECRTAVLAALRSATGVTVYDGAVPDKVPLDAGGYIKPYVVVFSSDGDALPETSLDAVLDMLSLRWDFQTTTVAASPSVCTDVAVVVRRTMTNFPLGNHHVLPSPLDYATPPIKDTDIAPARYFIPRMWRLDTT